MSEHVVNVLAAIIEPKQQDLRKNFELIDPRNPELGYVREVLTPEERKILGKHHRTSHWKQMNSMGVRHNVMSFYIPSPEIPGTGGRLMWIEGMLAKWPGDSFIVGVWNPDGSQYGTTIIPAVTAWNEETGESDILVPESIEGTPVYPISDRVMECMPDDVTYDPVTGAEVTRVPASKYKDVIQMSGWKPRRWS